MKEWALKWTALPMQQPFWKIKNYFGEKASDSLEAVGNILTPFLA
jgi:hypothetical protein